MKPFLSLSDSELIKGKGLIKLEWTRLLSHQLPRMYCVWQRHMHDATCLKTSVHCYDSCAYSAHNSLAIACWPDSSGALDVTLDKQIFRHS